MVRVVVVHNRYRSDVPSGENKVVDHDMAALRAAGHDVFPYLRDSDEIAGFSVVGRAGLAARPLHSPPDARALGALLDQARPDVVHVHNVFPLISPSVVRVAVARGVPVVQSVHNYRHGCVAGTFYRDGRICEDCTVARLPWPAVVHGCYRGSRAQSVPMAAAQVAHRRTWQKVDRFMAVTEFMAGKLGSIGLPESRIVVRPNAVADPGPPTGPGRGFLFVGRFHQEKGVLLLLEAWRRSGLGDRETLVLAGGGPLEAEVRRMAAASEGVVLSGPVAPHEVGRLMTESAAVVVPSLWYEGFPQVIVEAFARGRPVVVTDGALAGLVDDAVGWRAAADPDSLAACLVRIAAGGDRQRGAAARARYVERFTPEVVMRQLLDVYRSVQH